MDIENIELNNTLYNFVLSHSSEFNLFFAIPESESLRFEHKMLQNIITKIMNTKKDTEFFHYIHDDDQKVYLTLPVGVAPDFAYKTKAFCEKYRISEDYSVFIFYFLMIEKLEKMLYKCHY